jgi:hypothetical protein
MLQELKIDDFESARPLFGGFDYSLSIQAAIEGFWEQKDETIR